jgi:NADH:ubiquinone oxidoreductase subunit F (NADH-binding)
MLGSAGVVAIPEGEDIARLAQRQLAFFAHESCGQCAPCRVGTRWLHERLSAYLEGGDPAALAGCEDVAWEMREASICGLGVAAPAPLESARRHFPQAFGPRPPGEGVR